jgi:hypothetical protein
VTIIRSTALACALLGFASPAIAQSECPPQPPPPICLLVTLRDPSPANAVLLRDRLRADGVRAGGGPRSFTISATPGRLRRAFGVRVRYTRTGASSSDRMICQPTLRNVTVPERYRDLIARIRYDPQLC